MIGYHYTDKRNWLGIKRYGLVPYFIDKPCVREKMDGPVRGIWIWTHPLTGIAHAGSIIYQLATKNTQCVALLRVKYSEYDEWHNTTNDIARVHHYGHIGKFRYHYNEEAVILTRPVSCDKIELLYVYDFEKAFKDVMNDSC